MAAPVAVAAPVTTTAASTDASREVRVVTYPGDGETVRLGELARLSATSGPFRTLVKRQLTRLWRAAGGTEECRSAPYVTVRRWRSDGYASLPSIGTGSPCPGGGFRAVAVRRGEAWSIPAVLAGQDTFWCTDLRHFGVPGTIAEDSCLDDLGTVRSYGEVRRPRGIDTPAYAARVAVAATRRGDLRAAGRFATPAVVDDLAGQRADGALLRTGRCFGRGDDELGRYLREGSRGCVVDSEYDGGSYRVLSVLELRPGALDRWRGVRLEAYASS